MFSWNREFNPPAAQFSNPYLSSWHAADHGGMTSHWIFTKEMCWNFQIFENFLSILENLDAFSQLIFVFRSLFSTVSICFSYIGAARFPHYHERMSCLMLLPIL